MGVAGAKMWRILVVAVAAIMVSGCGSMPERDRNTLIGIGPGAGVGALVGAGVASGGTAIAAGAIIGGATGGAIGYLIRPEGCYFRNRRGEIWQVPCHDLRIRAHACFIGHGPDDLQEVPCSYHRVARRQ
jgi:hypothetical protein